MLKIHKRPSVDKLVSEQRVESASWGRRIYLALLAMLGLVILNYLFGDMVFLRAEGILLTDRDVVAATYPGQVVKVEVTEGQEVKKGAVLVRMESAQMVRDIAELTLKAADLIEKNAQLQIKFGVVKTLLPLAERHLQESAATLDDFDALEDKGLVSNLRMNDAVENKFDASQKLAELQSQRKLYETQLPNVVESSKRAIGALNSLKTIYANGVIVASRDGTVGPKVPTQGQAVNFGDDLLTLYGSETYVLAYLSSDYLFEVEPGERVRVSSGSRTVEGRIEAVLGVADALPPEFQNLFKPRDRGRLVRIAVDGGEFAVAQKVSVRGCWLICDGREWLASRWDEVR
ncbi:multidrug resistance protein MdtN [Methyloligella halotolerans]|uniref:Multidrug resistance protein MdtN n=1 Tax=Methyloligella halotolerans TaxID=1177755 RepID=A0A1E2S1N0_9HYPH|nr:efflux RND transporter periplasmic adaptor subunit [Methyloligella halotolerans]ODA68248.1 multidrug resistance protein MdtN [Methyloligella halotolerans]